MYGSFRPWKDVDVNEKKYKLVLSNKVRQNKDNPQEFFKSLLFAFKDMAIKTDDGNLTEFKYLTGISIDPKLQQEINFIDFPRHYNKTSEFFLYLIKNYTILTINAVINELYAYTTDYDIKYHAYRFLKVSKNQLEQTANSFPLDKQTSLILDYLKLSLFNIHFEIQHRYIDFIDSELLNIDEAIYLIQPNFETEKTNDQSISSILNNYVLNTATAQKRKGKPEDEKLSFNYNRTSTEILENIFTPLALKIDFINEELTSKDDFIKVMTAKNIKGLDIKIHIGCETTQFRYILNKMKPFFKNLTLANIEKSELFFSKYGVMIKASNLSRNKNLYPKEKENIDNVFKELQ